jgi:hypothetical protein
MEGTRSLHLSRSEDYRRPQTRAASSRTADHGTDLQRKLADFQVDYNVARSHTALDSDTPWTFAGEHAVAPADVNHVRWVSHCRDWVSSARRPDNELETDNHRQSLILRHSQENWISTATPPNEHVQQLEKCVAMNVTRSPTIFRRALMRIRYVALSSLVALFTSGAAAAQDPREGLDAGLFDAGTASHGLVHTATLPKPLPFNDPDNPGNIAFLSTDIAFKGDVAFVGNFNGFLAYDISDPDNPAVLSGVLCPGGPADLSVFGNLLFISVEETRARVACTDAGPFLLGLRIFDITDARNPRYVAAVQTCRGSRRNTVVTDPADPNNIYIYSSGPGNVRPESGLAGCNNNPADGENPSRWSIDVIKVPLAAPQNAAVVSRPRIFADPVTGALDGLQNAPQALLHPSGQPWGPTPITDGCVDIVAFPEIGLAAGACEGNGILLDIRDPVNPVRLDAVADPNVSYFAHALFSNDGNKIVFTDEWGGGTSGRCRVTDRADWGAAAIYDVVDNNLVFRSYFKMPAAQAIQETCVAAGLGIVPIPGRDVFAQGWFQGGHTLVDFTDSSNPKEIAFFDRGPISATSLVLGGLWSTYYYNGRTFGSEIARGFDVFRYTPTADLSANEIAAAEAVTLGFLSPQLQSRIVHAPSFTLVRSYLDQLVRADAISDTLLDNVIKFIDRAETFSKGPQRNAVAAQLRAAANQLSHPDYAVARNALLQLAATF